MKEKGDGDRKGKRTVEFFGYSVQNKEGVFSLKRFEYVGFGFKSVFVGMKRTTSL